MTFDVKHVFFGTVTRLSNFSLFSVEKLYEKPRWNRFSYGKSSKQVFRHLIFGELEKFRLFPPRAVIAHGMVTQSVHQFLRHQARVAGVSQQMLKSLHELLRAGVFGIKPQTNPATQGD